MLLKEEFWIKVDTELKKRGSKLEVKEVSPFEAYVDGGPRKILGINSLKIALHYQPKEGNVKGYFTLSFVITPEYREKALKYLAKKSVKSLKEIYPWLRTRLEMTPEEEKSWQDSMISPYGDEDTPGPVGRAWILVHANVVSPHGQDFIDRISPWIAEWIDNLQLVHGYLNRHVAKAQE